ncbi:hypothetical protein Tco_1063782 [Tanacetum coccineum]
MGTPTQVCVRSCPNISAPAGRPFRCFPPLSGCDNFVLRELPNKVGVKVTNLDMFSIIEDEKLFGDLSDKDAVRGLSFVIVGGSGYQQKDRKPSQNDKTEHGMEKTVQNQGQSPKMPKSESI